MGFMVSFSLFLRVQAESELRWGALKREIITDFITGDVVRVGPNEVYFDPVRLGLYLNDDVCSFTFQTQRLIMISIMHH